MPNPSSDVAPAPPAVFFASWRSALLTAVLLAGVVCAARTLLVLSLGSSAPFWDQWFAEGTDLYLPQLRNSFDWNHLWEPHNEHRIVLARLLATGLFWLNDAQWDGRVQSLANAAIYAGVLGLLGWYLCRRLRPVLAWPLIALVALIGVLPFGWENALTGFQSPFYLLMLFALLLFWTVAYRPATPVTAVLLALLSALAQFTVASAALLPAVALGVVALRWLGGREGAARAALLAAPLALVLLVTAACFPALPVNPMKAEGLREMARAFLLAASWPLPSPAVVLLLLPVAWFGRRFLRLRQYDPADGFFAALVAWGLMTAAAIAHTRGHDLEFITSRYTESLAMGGLGAAYFALRLLQEHGGAPLLKRGLAAVPLLLAAGLMYQTWRDWPLAQERAYSLRMGVGHVRAYLEGDSTVLDGKHGHYILFPFAEKLKSILEDPLLRRMLPVSLLAGGGQMADGRPADCRWSATGAGALQSGEVRCATAADPSGVPLGRLSRATYTLWKSMHFNFGIGFSPADPLPLDPALRCSLDLVNLERIQAGAKLRMKYVPAIRLTGWTLLPGEAPTDPVLIDLVPIGAGQAYRLTAANRTQQRPELGSIFQDPRQNKAGFDTYAHAAMVPPGSYRVQLSRSGSGTCDANVILNISGTVDERLLY